MEFVFVEAPYNAVIPPMPEVIKASDGPYLSWFTFPIENNFAMFDGFEKSAQIVIDAV